MALVRHLEFVKSGLYVLLPLSPKLSNGTSFNDIE